MRRIRVNIVARLCLITAIILQSLLPTAYALAEASGHDVSDFICNPSNAAPSPQAQSEIETLLSLLEGQASEDPAEISHEACSDCVVHFYSILNLTHLDLTAATFDLNLADYFQNDPRAYKSARGPPLGGRAPPYFL